MKLYTSVLLFALSSSAFADGWFVGPRFGHQNLKVHSKGSEFEDVSASFNSSGPIILTPSKSFDNDSSQVFFNSTVEGIRLGYDMESFSLVSDFDMARYYSTGAQINLLSFGLGGQFSLVRTPGLNFYSLLGFSLRSIQLKLYETSFAYDFESFVESADVEFKRINVINYDMGLGLSLPLSEQMHLVFEAKYSDTLSKGTAEVQTNYLHRNQTNSVEYTTTSKSKNYTWTTQELTVGLLFSL